MRTGLALTSALLSTEGGNLLWRAAAGNVDARGSVRQIGRTVWANAQPERLEGHLSVRHIARRATCVVPDKARTIELGKLRPVDGAALRNVARATVEPGNRLVQSGTARPTRRGSWRSVGVARGVYR